ncbi:MAG: hypothetical protein EXS35_17065 [Pedosphaera sp.]|nr:hypothetical protein [Pedosphaera sp.]
MPEVLTILVLVLLVALAIFVAVRTTVATARKRQGEMASLARRLGLRFDPRRDDQLPKQFRFLDKLAEGSNRHARNLISGNYNQHRVLLFDYHFVTGSGNSQRQNDISFFMLFLPLPFPEVKIAPEGIFAKLAGMFGFEDIKFESAEFSRAFHVRARDKKFAYDICHPKMMEFLLGNRDLSIEIEGRVLALAFERQLNSTEFVFNLTRLLQVRSLFPKYLFP